MKAQQRKRTKIFSNLRKNCKLEIALALVCIVFFALERCIPTETQLIRNYFTENRCAGIAGYTVMIIGIYVAVWSIFATSAAKINEKLLKEKVEDQLFFLIAVGLGESFFTTVFCVFVPSQISVYMEAVLLLTLLTSISFIKFTITLMLITKLNIKYIVEEIDSRNSECVDAKVKLEEIYHRITEK